jgi:hypothetical protein
VAKEQFEKLNIYPTDEQIRTLYGAWEKGGKKALGEALRKQNQELREKKALEKK